MDFKDNIILALTICGTIALVTITGFVVGNQYGSEWFPLLNIAVSAALSSALILLYFRQSSILQSQKELLKLEMNRGVREQHTETLRDRVRDWHGNPDRETSYDPTKQPSKNLPSIGTVSFSSVPSQTRIAFGPGEEEFRVIPRELENDRYLRDLLENHAHDLRQQAEQVHELQEQFDTLRHKFCNEFDYGSTHQFEQFTLEPQDYLHKWFFEHLIRLEREYTDDFADLRERMIRDLGETSRHPEKPIFWIMADASEMEQRAVYGARHKEDTEVDWRNSRSKVVGEIEDVISRIITEVESDYPFDNITRAAEKLNQGAIAVEELEQILIEYDGKPIYQEECEYLHEAEITT